MFLTRWSQWLRHLNSRAAAPVRRRRNWFSSHRPQLERLEDRCLLSTFTVINDASGGFGSLQWAVSEANFFAGEDRIEFNIPSSGVHTIATALEITDPVTIDGYTQPGAHANTLAVGNDAVVLIELDGSSAGAGV